jgi:hypothetical protein
MPQENAKKVETSLRERDAPLMEVETEVEAAPLVAIVIVVATAEESARMVAEVGATVAIERRRRDGRTMWQSQTKVGKG